MGSEMCIRDRLQRSDTQLGKVRDLTSNVEKCAALVWEARSKERCLLYTSDAADERSSVDLGGRRIIKKKKTETINNSDDYRKVGTRKPG